MNRFAEFLNSSRNYSTASTRPGTSVVSPPHARKNRASTLNFNLFFCLCACLVAAHLLVVSFAPRNADGLIYALWAMSIFTYAGVVVLQVRAAAGMLSLRWSLFALSLLCYGANDVLAAVGDLFDVQAPRLDSTLLAIAATLVLLAITLPSGERVARLSLLDTAVAIVFCSFRFLHLLTLMSKDIAISSVLAHYTFDPLIRVTFAVIALAACPWTKRMFYRNVTLYLVADFLVSLCVNQIGYLWLHQHTASPWTLTGTLVPLAGSFYLLGSFTTTHAQSRIQFNEPTKPVFRTLLPFAMTLLIVILSAELVPIHLRLAKLGMAFAAAAFFARVALLARHQDLVEGSLRNALRNQNWKEGPDPLDKVEAEANLAPALWQARSLVSWHAPLSLLILKVEEMADGLVALESGLESGNLIPVARHLSQWRPAHSNLYYLGESAFVMLLPSVSHRGALQLASQIRTSIEALCLMGESGFTQLSVGTASAFTAAGCDLLLAAACDNLPQSQTPRLQLRFPRFRHNVPAS